MFSGTPSEVLGTVELQDEEETTETENQEVEETEIEDSGLVQEEEQEQGVVRLLVYKSYWFAVGTCLAPLVLIALFLMQGMVVKLSIKITMFTSTSYIIRHEKCFCVLV